MEKAAVIAAPQIILATLNAKYIHASLGLRYLLSNLDQYGGGGLREKAVLREFTLVRKPLEIATALLAELGEPRDGAPQIVGFGIYIWNVTATTEVVRHLKQIRPSVIVVLGGPEVSYEWEDQVIAGMADHLITGWGEVTFAKLCHALINGPRPLMKIIRGEQASLDQIVMPYSEYSSDDLAHRLLYVEASRGCPFKCEFCLSSLDKTAWAFPLESFIAELDQLYRRGARNFKFVDRTFNLKIDSSIRILHFFLERLTPDLFIHFEVIPDHLPDRLKDVIARFPGGVLQFEIGIQSFNPEVQQLISRRQDNNQTEANVRWLVEHSQAHLHTDLIFGLPGETLESFATGFDRLYALKPDEIQLGILKRLRGTPISRHTEQQKMRYDAQPPYAVQETALVDSASLQRVTRLTRYWDLIANSGRFPRTLPMLLEGPSAFYAFLKFTDWLWQKTQKTSGLSPEMLVDIVFTYLVDGECRRAEDVRRNLLEDYQASGARANPGCLKGLLNARPTRSPRQGLAQRQSRHTAQRPR